MSASQAVQDAVVAALLADSGVSSFVGSKIYDNAKRRTDYPYIALESVQVVTDKAECINGFEVYHDWHVWDQMGGSKRRAEQICAAIHDCLDGANLDLSPYALVLVEVQDWIVKGDPDEQVAHGIVSLKAVTEG